MNDITNYPRGPGQYTINVYNPSIDYFLQRFSSDEHFSSARYQDNWWKTTHTTLPQEYRHPTLAESLPLLDPEKNAKSFVSLYSDNIYDITYDVAYENFLLLSQSRPNMLVGVKCMRSSFSRCIPCISLKQNFIYANCWRDFATSGDILRIFDDNKAGCFVLIGPSYFHSLGDKLGLPRFHHIEIDGQRACHQFENVVASAIELCNRVRQDKKLFIFCVGGYVGNAIVNRLHDSVSNAFIIEMGRALDAIYTYDNEFRSLPDFWWSGDWVGTKDNPKEWTAWAKAL